jgi:sugar phosphate isomerase/epimerase
MKIFFSSTNIKRPLMNGKVSLEELPAIANQYEFDGIDILDRYIKDADLNYIKSRTKSLGLGAILSINTDLTVSNPKLNHQLEYFQNMLKLGKDLGASVIRFTLGGGRLSFQTVLSYIEAVHLLPQKVAVRLQYLAQKLFLSRPVSVLIQKAKGKKPVPSFDHNNCDKVVSAIRNILPLVL